MKANVKCSVKFKHKTTLDYKICMKDFRRYTELHFCDITLNKKTHADTRFIKELHEIFLSILIDSYENERNVL